ncbi:MAG: hypothetical protein ACO1N0_02015 [Fluviicola sp.]
MQKLVLILFFFQLTAFCYSQEPKTESDWQKVEIRIIESRKTVNKLELAGEAMLKITKQIKEISDLTEEQVMELKKRAAKDNCKFVYIDTKGVYDSSYYTLYSKGKLYYYWANEK